MSETIQLAVTETPVESIVLTDHEQLMIDKVDGKSTDNANTLIAGKYKDESAADKGTLEALVKVYGSREAAYKAVESLIGKTNPEDKVLNPPAKTTETTKPNTDKPLEITKADEALKEKGLDFKEFDKEFQEKGELSEASYKKLSDKGLSKELVDTYIEGVKAKVALQQAEGEKVVNAVYELSGGQEAYNTMVDWAKVNLTKEEIAVLNEGLNGDMVHAKFAAESLKQKYQTVNGKNPTLQLGNVSANSGDVFRSKSEMTTAMSDPRYNVDEAYTSDVILKIQRSSKIFG
jgi:hypothetical protein